MYHKLEGKAHVSTMLQFDPFRSIAIEDAIEQYASTLVECVLLGDKSWVFITHIDVFLQNDPTIDDCAYTKNNRYDKQSRAVKVQKTILRPSLQNVTLRLNSICEVPNPKKFDQDDDQKKEKALWRWRKNNIKIY